MTASEHRFEQEVKRARPVYTTSSLEGANHDAENYECDRSDAARFDTALVDTALVDTALVDTESCSTAANGCVVFLINSLEGGGAERVFSALVNRIAPHLLTTDIDVVLLDNKPQRYEIIPSMRITRLGGDGSLWSSTKRFGAYLAARRPTVVISFLTRANYLAVAFARRYGYRCIISERSDTHQRLGGGVSGGAKKWLVRTLYPRAHHVITVSDGIKCCLVSDFGVPERSISVIPNACDVNELQRLGQQPSPLMQDQRLQSGFILAVGRLVECKRFDVLLRAYAWGGFDLPLVILGEGPKMSELKALAQQLGVANRVLFPGFLTNPYSVMAHASVFVLCSDSEGFPNCLLEAMGLGVPVVATNCLHGPAEILDGVRTITVIGVHRGKHGLLVAPGDSGALAAAMQQVLASTALQSFLGARARRRAGDFSLGSTLYRYAMLINEQLQMAGAMERRL